MSYIGNLPTNVAFVTDTFSGNGSTVAFTTSVAPASTSSILVAVTGVLQDPSTYSVSGTTLTFSAAPPSGTGNISVRYLGIPASGVTTTAYRTVTEFTATAGQTSFSVPSYTVGYIDVYRNGSKLGSADFTATNGTTVVLAAACNAGDLVQTVSFYVSSVLNAIPATAGAVNDSYISAVSASKLTGSRTLPSGTLPAGTVLQVVGGTYQVSTATTFTSTSLTASGFTQTITPTSSSSKILVIWTSNLQISSPVGAGFSAGVTMYRGATNLATGTSPSAMAVWQTPSASGNSAIPCNITVLDSPATTSPVTYQPYVVNQNASQNVNFPCTPGVASSSTYTFILMEIAA